MCDSFGSLIAVIEVHNCQQGGGGFTLEHENLLCAIGEVVGGLVGYELLHGREVHHCAQYKHCKNTARCTQHSTLHAHSTLHTHTATCSEWLSGVQNVRWQQKEKVNDPITAV